MNDKRFETKLLLFKAQNLQGRITLMLKGYKHSKVACKTLEGKILQSHKYVEDLINSYESNIIYFENKRYYLTFSNYLRLLDSILGFLTEFASKGMFMRFIQRDTYKKSLLLLSQEIEKSLSALKHSLSANFSAGPESDKALISTENALNLSTNNIDDMKGNVNGTDADRTQLLSQIQEVNSSTNMNLEGLELPDRQIKVIPGESPRQGRNFAVHKRIYKSVEVAEKVYRGSLNDKKVLTQIYKQVAILKKLEVCPFIIKFYGTHKKSTSFGLITEYASLGNLKEVLASGQTLETPVMINMTTNIVEGVAFLHNLGILHKNIKTSSIMVTSEYKAKISGFEFSRETDVDIYTVPVVDLGSDRHRWIPPEKIRSYAASTQGGDVYSVGMVLWSLWTGRYPYQSFKDRQAVEEYVLNGGREDMTIVNPLILPIIKLCFHEDTNKRPTSAQLINDIDQTVSKEFDRESTMEKTPPGSLMSTQTSYLENKNNHTNDEVTKITNQIQHVKIGTSANVHHVPSSNGSVDTRNSNYQVDSGYFTQPHSSNINSEYRATSSYSYPFHNNSNDQTNINNQPRATTPLQSPPGSATEYRSVHSQYNQSPMINNNSNGTFDYPISPPADTSPNTSFRARGLRSLENSQFGEHETDRTDILEGENIASLLQDPLELMEQAVIDHNERRNQEAFDKFTELQRYGYTRADYFLGYYYFWGQEKVVEKNIPLATFHLERAAAADDSDALDLLGLVYRDSDNPNLDLVKAFSYFKRSAELGNRKGYYHLFAAYAAGRGTSRNPLLAREMLIKSASLGYPSAIQQAQKLGIHF